MNDKMLTVAEIEDSLTMMPGFPCVVLDLLAAAGDEKEGDRVLATFMRRDPITASGLRLTTEQDRQSLKERVLIHSLGDFACQLGRGADVLEHGLAVGRGAQALGRFCGLNPEFALVAGLLHDIGRSWMAYWHPKTYARVADQVARGWRTTCDVEHDLFGMDHCEVGYYVSRFWGLPPAIVDAIALHHRPRLGMRDWLAGAIQVAEVRLGNRGLLGGVDVRASAAASGAADRGRGRVSGNVVAGLGSASAVLG